MFKLLFFDNRGFEIVRGFDRQLEQPKKYRANPLFVADQPWENSNMQLYGSVVKPPNRPFQMWYSVIHKPFRILICYAESDDGITWRKPLLDIYKFKGRKTNVVLNVDAHGAAVIFDEQDPNPARRYKMLAGAEPSKCICAFVSSDGIRWSLLTRFPVMTTYPDCPIGFLRESGGRYVAYHRRVPYGRRVCRSTSWDFRNWDNEPRLVLEPDVGDPPQLQFYGIGSAQYGGYEIGTLWMFHTDEDELGRGHIRGYQEAELTYARSGYAWHRAAQGTPFLPHGRKGEWDSGNLQCASQPVFLEDEIRYYYVGSTMRHKLHWELDPQTAGLGMATLQPDRFIGLNADRAPAELLTICHPVRSGDFFLNARIKKDGYVCAELLTPEGKPIKGLASEDFLPITGDSTSHRLQWKSPKKADRLKGTFVRLRLKVRSATIYSIYNLDVGETPAYHKFSIH